MSQFEIGKKLRLITILVFEYCHILIFFLFCNILSCLCFVKRSYLSFVRHGVLSEIQYFFFNYTHFFANFFIVTIFVVVMKRFCHKVVFLEQNLFDHVFFLVTTFISESFYLSFFITF